jgi:hypothetical protein
MQRCTGELIFNHGGTKVTKFHKELSGSENQYYFSSKVIAPTGLLRIKRMLLMGPL